MSLVGLITEYNPFHNGHLYHLEESKKLTGCDYSVCVMSGNFIQRGEPALIDKWTRAQMAVKAGVDLVVELPVVYAVQTAELFAYGSVKILDSLGIVDSICFGSEAGNIGILDEISSILIEEPEEFKISLKSFLDTGITFPVARAKALMSILKSDDENLEKLLNSSNNILAIEYIKALKRLKSSIKPATITRVKNEYNSTGLKENISSATSIRHALFETQDVETIENNVPRTTFETLAEKFSKGYGPIFSSNFDHVVLSTLRRMPTSEIAEIFDVNEGLEHRIKKASMETYTVENLIKAIKTKRYTQTRLQRILIHALLGIKRDLYKDLAENGGPQYIRVLGFNEKGQKLLNTAKKKASLPIITKVANFTNTENELFNRMFELDIAATDLYTLARPNPSLRRGGLDFTHHIIIEK